MRRTLALWAVLMIFTGIAGCADNPIDDPVLKEPESRVFYENYDDLWRAIQLAVRKYPVHLNNIESGILETDYIKGDKIFSDPPEKFNKPGLRYKITIRAVKGKISDKPAVKVVVVKTAEVQPDFFTGYQPFPSDGYEENTLLYRIGRYLDLDKLLNKQPSKNN